MQLCDIHIKYITSYHLNETIRLLLLISFKTATLICGYSSLIISHNLSPWLCHISKTTGAPSHKTAGKFRNIAL